MTGRNRERSANKHRWRRYPRSLDRFACHRVDNDDVHQRVVDLHDRERPGGIDRTVTGPNRSPPPYDRDEVL